jgi:hypothetical protein
MDHGFVHVEGSSIVARYSMVLSLTRVKRSVTFRSFVEPR